MPESLQKKIRDVGQGLLSAPTGSVREKARFDVVSDLDHWAEREMTAFLQAAFPGDTILSEESASSVDYAPRIWVLDPLDGTLNRTTNIPLFGVSLALLVNGSPRQGYIYDPTHDELFHAEAGQGAFLNGEPIRVNDEGVRAVGVTSGVLHRLVTRAPEHYLQLAQTYGKLRALGSHALQLAYVACGRLIAAASVETRIWDNAAGALLVQEAGGRYTELSGKPAFPVSPGDAALRGEPCPCLAAAPDAHGTLLPWLKDLVGSG